MAEYCPRRTCDWQNKYDGKCHWPTDNCPYKAAREAAGQKQQRLKQEQEQARRKRRLGIAVTPPGVYERSDGRFRALIQAGRNGKKGLYVLGTYDTIQEAAAVRKLAELHRKNGDLAAWAESRRQASRQG